MYSTRSAPGFKMLRDFLVPCSRIVNIKQAVEYAS